MYVYVQTLRGVNFDIGIAEEAASMSQDVFYKIIVPLLEVDKTALLCVSTPLSEFNFYSVLTDVTTDDGTLVFETQRVTLACPKCAKMRERMGVKESGTCKHKEDVIPKWKCPDRHRQVEAIYKSVDRTDDFQRESQGVITSVEGYIFLPPMLQYIHDQFRAPAENNHVPPFMIITIDPDGGGLTPLAAELGVVTCYYVQGRMIIAGMYTHKGTPDETAMSVAAHIGALRQVPRFSSSHIFLIPEANTHAAGQNYVFATRHIPRLTVVHDASKTIGMRVTATLKLQYASETQMRIQERSICVDRDWVGRDRRASTYQSEMQTVVAKLVAQLRLLKQVKTPGGAQQTVTGKFGEDGKPVPGQNDDLAIAFIMNSTMYRFLTSGAWKLRHDVQAIVNSVVKGYQY